MKQFGLFNVLGLLLLTILFNSCENELHVTLPQGPAGLSSYDLWVEGVGSGDVDWPKDRVGKEHFFLYMKGETGKDGDSAYELWIKEVHKGIKDPHNPTQQWDKNKTELNDFWYYLTGADGKNGSTPVIGHNGNWWIDGVDTGKPSKGVDGKDGSKIEISRNNTWVIDGTDTGISVNGQDGQGGNDGEGGKSAYELWKEEVAKGLKNPHSPTGDDWPKNRISMSDFWEYLRGSDGQDGETEQIIVGYPNVIAQFSQQENNEYVRWSDGAVLYKVFDDLGKIAPNAVLKGLPGMEPEKQYTSDENGEFLIGKDDLPVGKSVSELTGSVKKVTYKKSTGEIVTEQSPSNTYVPNKVNVRVVKKHFEKIILIDQFIGLGFLATQRHIGTPDAVWEDLPDYLGDFHQSFSYFELNDKDDPTSYDAKKPIATVSSNIRSGRVSIRRPLIPTDYIMPKEDASVNRKIWDGEDHYYVIQMSSYYGEKPVINAVFKNAPLQHGPIVKEFRDIEMSAESTDYIKKITVELDLSHIKPEHIYKEYNVVKTVNMNGVDYDYWEAIVADAEVFKREQFLVKFEYGNTKIESNPQGSLNYPVVTFKDVFIHSSSYVFVIPDIYLFKSVGLAYRIGSFKYNKTTNKLDFNGLKYENSDAVINVPNISGIDVE